MSSGNGFDPKRVLSIQLNRRSLLASAAAGAAAATVPSVIRPGHRVAAAGQLNVLALSWPQAPVEQQLANDKFAKDTGIAVTIEQNQYDFMEQRIYQLVAGKSKQYDIYHYDSQWIGGFVKAGALERLDTPDYLGNSASTVKFDDFFPELSYRLGKYPTKDAELVAGNFAAFAETPVHGLPWSLNAECLWYRSDLISTPPASWDELREMAKTVTKGDVYGMAYQGTRISDFATVGYLPIMWSFGGQLWDPNTYKADGFVNGPDAVAALQFQSDMVNVDKSVDAASGNWGFNEILGAILQGKTAMALFWVPLLGGIADDPAQSLVAGKIEFAPTPKGPKSQAAMYGCQGTGINALSENKPQAWQYLQWLTSKETQQAIQDDATAGFISARKDLRDAIKYPWQQVFAEEIPLVRDMWNIPEYQQLLTAMGSELNLAYIGRKTAEDALNDLATTQQAILDSSPDKPAA